ncbi:MAG: hypothetical protein WC423_16760 [Vulcanimicrobiota bacterium]
MEFVCSQCGATPEKTLPESGKFECPFCTTPYLLVSDEEKVNTKPLWLGQSEPGAVYFPFWRVYLKTKASATEYHVEETVWDVGVKRIECAFEREACFWIPATDTENELGIEIDVVATDPSYNFFSFEDCFATTEDVVPKGKHRLINPAIRSDQAAPIAQNAVEREIKEDAFREHQDIRDWTTFEHHLLEPPALVYRAVKSDNGQIKDLVSDDYLTKNEPPPIVEKKRDPLLPLYRFVTGVSLCWLSYPLLAYSDTVWMFLVALVPVYFGLKPLLRIATFGRYGVDERGLLTTESDTKPGADFASDCLDHFAESPLAFLLFLLLGLFAFCLYPFFAGILGMFKGQGFFKGLFEGLSNQIRFSIRIALALVIVGFGLAGLCLGAKVFFSNYSFF